MTTSSSSRSIAILFLFLLLIPIISSHNHNQGEAATVLQLTPFSTALERLQKLLRYNFKRIGLLRRAMTHASFSEENNKALSIFGANIIETSVSFHSLSEDIDISSKELNRQVSQISNVKSSCAMDGIRLGLEKVVRVSPKTNSSLPGVVCDAFRAIFGAIAIDNGTSDAAGDIFWTFHHSDELGVSLPL